MRRLTLFLLMMGLSATAGAVPVAAAVSEASKVAGKVAGVASTATSLLGLKGPPAYVPSIPVPPIVPVNMCVNGVCYPLLSPRPCVCNQTPPIPGTNLCQMYIPCNAARCGTGFCVTDLTMLPGSRQFYETLRLKEFGDTSKQLSYLLLQRTEQNYLLSGIKNAIGMPDKQIKALIEESLQTSGAPTEFGCLRCDSLVDLAIKQNKIPAAQRTQSIMQCSQKALSDMMDTYKDGRNNTVFTAQKNCLIATCQSATLAHATYSMQALSDLRRIHADMLKIFSEYVPKTLYEPCVEDLSVFKNNPLAQTSAMLKAVTGLADQIITNPILDVMKSISSFLGSFKNPEMMVFGCVNRSLALIQKLEADRSLLEQYKAHLQSLRLLSESMNTICTNPTYFVPQEKQR